VDNALAYQEIQRLKERLIDENLALTEQINNVAADFGEIIGQSQAMRDVMRQGGDGGAQQQHRADSGGNRYRQRAGCQGYP
jgi:hypothetical protein